MDDALAAIARNRGDLAGTVRQLLSGADFHDVRASLDCISEYGARSLSKPPHALKFVHLANAVLERREHREHLNSNDWEVLARFLLDAYVSFTLEITGFEAVKTHCEVFRALAALMDCTEAVSSSLFQQIFDVCAGFVGSVSGNSETSGHRHVLHCIRKLVLFHFDGAIELGNLIVEQAVPRTPEFRHELALFGCIIPQPTSTVFGNIPIITSREVEFVSSPEFGLAYFRPSSEADLRKFIAVRAAVLAVAEHQHKRVKLDHPQYMLLAFKGDYTLNIDMAINWLQSASSSRAIFWALVWIGIYVDSEKDQIEDVVLESIWKVASSFLCTDSSSAACFCLAKCTPVFAAKGEGLVLFQDLLQYMQSTAHIGLSSGSICLYNALSQVEFLDDNFYRLRHVSLSMWLAEQVTISQPLLLTHLFTSGPQIYLDSSEADNLRSVVDFRRITRAVEELEYPINNTMEASKSDVMPLTFNVTSIYTPVCLRDHLWKIALSATSGKPLGDSPPQSDAFTNDDLMAFVWFSNLANQLSWDKYYCDAALALAAWDLPARESQTVSVACLLLQRPRPVVCGALSGDMFRLVTMSRTELRELQPFLQSYEFQRAPWFLQNVANLLAKAPDCNEKTQLTDFLFSVVQKQSQYSPIRVTLSDSLPSIKMLQDLIEGSGDWLKLQMLPDNDVVFHRLIGENGEGESIAKSLINVIENEQVRLYTTFILTRRHIISPATVLTMPFRGNQLQDYAVKVSRGIDAINVRPWACVVVPLSLKLTKEKAYPILSKAGAERQLMDRAEPFLTAFDRWEFDEGPRKALWVTENIMRDMSILSTDAEKVHCVTKCLQFLENSSQCIPEFVITTFIGEMCALLSHGSDMLHFQTVLEPLITRAVSHLQNPLKICEAASCLWMAKLTNLAFNVLKRAPKSELSRALLTLPENDLAKTLHTFDLLRTGQFEGRYELWFMTLNYAVTASELTRHEDAFKIMKKIDRKTANTLLIWTKRFELHKNSAWMSLFGRLAAVTPTLTYRSEIESKKEKVIADHAILEPQKLFYTALRRTYKNLPYTKKWKLAPLFQRLSILSSDVAGLEMTGEGMWNLEADFRPSISQHQLSSDLKKALVRANSIVISAMNNLKLPSMGNGICQEVPELVEEVVPTLIALWQSSYGSKHESMSTSDVIRGITEALKSSSQDEQKMALRILLCCCRETSIPHMDLETILAACLKNLSDVEFVYLGIFLIEMHWANEPQPLSSNLQNCMRTLFSYSCDAEVLQNALPSRHGQMSLFDAMNMSSHPWEKLTFGLVNYEVKRPKLDDNVLSESLEGAGLWTLANKVSSKKDLYSFERIWWLQEWDSVNIFPQIFTDHQKLYNGLEYGSLIGFFKKQLSEEQTFAALAQCKPELVKTFQDIILPPPLPTMTDENKAAAYSKSEQVARWGREVLLRREPDVLQLAQELKSSCEALRNEGEIFKSLEYAIKLERLSSRSNDSKVRALSLVESAETEWHMGQQICAISKLKEVLELQVSKSAPAASESTFSDTDQSSLENIASTSNIQSSSRYASELDIATIYCTVAMWSRETLNESDASIIESYFEKAVSLVNESNAEFVLHSYAKFCDDAFHGADLKKSLENARRAEANAFRQYTHLKELVMDNRSDIRVSSRMQQAKRLHESEVQNLKEIEGHSNRLLLTCVENYLQSLKAGNSHNQDMGRFIAIWLANCDNRNVNSTIKSALYLTSRPSSSYGSSSSGRQSFGAVMLSSRPKRLTSTLVAPLNKFLPWMNQLVSRLSSTRTIGQTDFQDILQDIILQACIYHPYHALWPLLNLSMTKIPLGSDKTELARKAAGTALLKQVECSIPKKCKVLQSFGSNIVELASATVPEDKTYVTLLQLSSKIEKWWTKTLLNSQLPVPTCDIPISVDGNYDDISFIQSVDTNVKIAGGISKPKIVSLFDNKGKKHQMVIKGSTKDDLRQDAIMQQVFRLAGELLKASRATRGLKIKTYNVIPCGATSGAIEFVSNTESLQEVLVPLHKLYGGPNEYSNRKARQLLSHNVAEPRAERIEIFKKVMKHTKSQMRRYWYQYFKDPRQCFHVRDNWCRSTAVMSIVGYAVGLGDRHCSNILLDRKTGECVHIDLGIAFDQSKLLSIPETVPFRLTRDMVDGMGVCGTSGIYTNSAVATLEVLRQQIDRIMTILEVLEHDTLYTWRLPPLKLKKIQLSEDESEDLQDLTSMGDNTAEQALNGVRAKLTGSLSCEAEVRDLVARARDINNLALMFYGWSAFY